MVLFTINLIFFKKYTMSGISSIGIKKRKRSLNKTRVILPLVSGDILPEVGDKFGNTINLIPEDGDQNIKTEDLESSLVINLDNNLFQPLNTETDLLIIEDSDINLLSCNSDFKNQLGYPLSFVNQDKNDTFPEDPEVKSKLKECSNENGIFEKKDGLIDNEKGEEKIFLDSMRREPKSFVTKIRKNIQSEGVVEEKRNKKNFQLIINYIPNLYTANQKNEPENCEILDSNIKNNGDENIFKKLVPDKEPSNYHNNLKADFNTYNVSEIGKKKIVLPEEGLTVTEKVKLQKEASFSDKQRSLLKQDLIQTSQVQDKFCIASKTNELNCAFELQESSVIASENSLSNEINKKKNSQKKWNGSASTGKSKNKKPLKSKKKSSNSVVHEFDITKFKNIYDLVEGLRKYRMISVPIWQMLNAGIFNGFCVDNFYHYKIEKNVSGLEEMNVDLLKEIINKRKKPEQGNYSPQLKAFAFIVYFKQPGTFNFLAKICKSGWPSVNVIKEWQQQLNNYQRPDFVGIEAKSENDVS